MKCKGCGAEVVAGAKFCSVCGQKVESGIDNDNFTEKKMERNKEKEKHNNDEKYSAGEMMDKIAHFITGGLSILAAIMFIGAWLGKFDHDPMPFLIFMGVVAVGSWLQDKLPKFPEIFFAVLEIAALLICFQISDRAGAVLAVKEGAPDQYPTITYEMAFGDYFEHPTWEVHGKDEDGNEVVRFTGTCSYLGNDVIAEIRFKVYKDQERFVVSAVKINDEDMGALGNVIVMDVFEEYQDYRAGKEAKADAADAERGSVAEEVEVLSNMEETLPAPEEEKLDDVSSGEYDVSYTKDVSIYGSYRYDNGVDAVVEGSVGICTGTEERYLSLAALYYDSNHYTADIYGVLQQISIDTFLVTDEITGMVELEVTFVEQGMEVKIITTESEEYRVLEGYYQMTEALDFSEVG